jgi:hypothetical protein
MTIGSVVKADVVTEMTAGHDKPSPRGGDEMTNAKKLPDKKLLGFPASHDCVETKLLGWIRGVLRSNDQLVEAPGALATLIWVLQTGKSVPDAVEILWQVEVALSDAQRSRERPCIEIFPGDRESIATLVGDRTVNILNGLKLIRACGLPLFYDL